MPDKDPATAPSTVTAPEKSPQTSSPEPAPTPLERAATFDGPSFSKKYEAQTSSGRMPPPARIDSQAASKMILLYRLEDAVAD